MEPVKFRLERHRDERGLFVELAHLGRSIPGCSGAPLEYPVFEQWNCSMSHASVFRGLHFQAHPHAQTKLITLLSGGITDCCLDIRPGPTFGQLHKFVLEVFEGVFVPPGFAHGFYAFNASVVVYGCSPARVEAAERTIAPPFSVLTATQSLRDRGAPALEEFAAKYPEELPR